MMPFRRQRELSGPWLGEPGSKPDASEVTLTQVLTDLRGIAAELRAKDALCKFTSGAPVSSREKS